MVPARGGRATPAEDDDESKDAVVAATSPKSEAGGWRHWESNENERKQYTFQLEFRPLKLLRLPPDVRREVLSYVVSASPDHGVLHYERFADWNRWDHDRRIDQTPRNSTSAALTTLIYHHRTTRTVCKELRRDCEFLESAVTSEMAAPVASPQAWLVHLYSVKHTKAALKTWSRDEIVKFLRRRATAGRRANLVGQLSKRIAQSGDACGSPQTRGVVAIRLHGMSTSRPRRRRDPPPRNIHVAAAASPRPASSEHSSYSADATDYCPTPGSERAFCSYLFRGADRPPNSYDCGLRCPPSWSADRRDAARNELDAYQQWGRVQDAALLSCARVRTNEEHFHARPVDTEVLDQLLIGSFGCMVQQLAGLDWTAQLYGAYVSFNGNSADGIPPMETLEAVQGKINSFFGADVMSDPKSMIQEFTNREHPTSYADWENECDPEDTEEEIECHAQCHDRTRPPTVGWRAAFEQAWENKRPYFGEDEDRVEVELISESQMPTCRIKVRLCFDGTKHAIDSEDIHNWVGIDYVEGPGGLYWSATGPSSGVTVKFPLRTFVSTGELPVRLDECICFVDLHENFTLRLLCYIPGLN